MAFTCGFFNSQNGDRKYNAEQMASIFDGLIKDGVYDTVGDIFAVTPGTGMQVLVGSGRAWFDHTWNNNDAPYPLAITAADVSLPRYDAVVLETNHSDTVRTNRLRVLTGTPASNPVKPTMASTTNVKQHPLAYIKVTAGATAITQSMIQVVVGTSECPFVTGIIDTAQIDALFQQWNGEFNEWFDNLKAQLSDNVVANLQGQIDQKVAKADVATTADIEAGTSNTKWVSPKGLRESGSLYKVGDEKISLRDLEEESDGAFLKCDGRALNIDSMQSLFEKMEFKYGGNSTILTECPMSTNGKYPTIRTLNAIDYNEQYMYCVAILTGNSSYKDTALIVKYNLLTNKLVFYKEFVSTLTGVNNPLSAGDSKAIVIAGQLLLYGKGGLFLYNEENNTFTSIKTWTYTDYSSYAQAVGCQLSENECYFYGLSTSWDNNGYAYTCNTFLYMTRIWFDTSYHINQAPGFQFPTISGSSQLQFPKYNGISIFDKQLYVKFQAYPTGSNTLATPYLYKYSITSNDYPNAINKFTKIEPNSSNNSFESWFLRYNDGFSPYNNIKTNLLYIQDTKQGNSYASGTIVTKANYGYLFYKENEHVYEKVLYLKTMDVTETGKVRVSGIPMFENGKTVFLNGISTDANDRSQHLVLNSDIDGILEVKKDSLDVAVAYNQSQYMVFMYATNRLITPWIIVLLRSDYSSKGYHNFSCMIGRPNQFYLPDELNTFVKSR